MKITSFFIIFISLLLLSKLSYAECKDYSIIERNGVIEAVCVGEPISEYENAKREKQITLENENQVSWEEDKRRRLAQLKLEEDKMKLSKVNCSLADRDCGPGRSCLMTVNLFYGSFGVCKETGQANINADRFNENMSNLRTQQKLDNIDMKLQKLDSIENKLRKFK